MNPYMKRSIEQIEYEIVHQILLCELCFDICNSIISPKIIPCRGSDFLPYYYNLNFTKGLLSLHSLLLSLKNGELSIRNYISEHKKNFPGNNIQDFEKKIASISDSFQKLSPIPLRPKIAAHIDESFQHTNFTSAYIIPTLVPEYTKIISQLKDVFFEFCNYTKNNKFHKIKEQSDAILKTIK